MFEGPGLSEQSHFWCLGGGIRDLAQCRRDGGASACPEHFQGCLLGAIFDAQDVGKATLSKLGDHFEPVHNSIRRTRPSVCALRKGCR